MKKFKPVVWLSTALALAGGITTHAYAASIDSNAKYAWSENAGWLNFAATGGNVKVLPDHLEGYVWADNLGWIRLGTHTAGDSHTYTNDSATTYGVNRNSSNGTLSGYAWSETAGWINFGATGGNAAIADDGTFSGYAWGDNIGWIKLAGTAHNGSAYRVKAAALISGAPTINPTNGSTITGTGTPGATITVTDANGGTVCTAMVGNDGNWSCNLDTASDNGTQLTASQGGKTSGTVTVDRITPVAPTLNPSTTTQVSGTGEPGATVTVTNQGGATVCTAIVDSEGNWECAPASPLTNGDTLTITQRDPSGNESTPVSGSVDNNSFGLNLSGHNTAIAHNDNTPSATDGTDFGTLEVTHGSQENTFTVYNHGSTPVQLNIQLAATGTASLPQRIRLALQKLNPIATAQAAGETDFSANPSSLTVPANGSATFSITFDPTANGTRQAQVNLVNNGNTVFSFRVQGVGVGAVAPAAPQNIPVFGPLGLWLMLGGLWWFGRRRRKP
ncbi:MAG: Ig-like domain-containing protein [Thiolinea sp.]